MKLLCLGETWPNSKAEPSSAARVVYEILNALCVEKQFELAYVCISKGLRDEANAVDRSALEKRGLVFLPPIAVTAPVEGGFKKMWKLYQSAVKAEPSDIVLGAREHIKILQAADAKGFKPDAVLTIFGELATAAASGLDIPKVAYYRTPDHKTELAMALFEHVNADQTASTQARYFWNRTKLLAQKRAHLNVMRKMSAVADVAANDARFYRNNGVKNSFYLNHAWAAPEIGDLAGSRKNDSLLKIVANIGPLDDPFNTFGLFALATEVLPVLVQRLGRENFEVHIFGPGELHPLNEELRNDPHVKFRGKVADLGSELLGATAFLLTNNHRGLVLGHTRILEAWSYGCPVIGYHESSWTMPEIKHGENALLAGSASELADFVAIASKDIELRRRLGRNGLETLHGNFHPAKVARVLSEQIQSLLA